MVGAIRNKSAIKSSGRRRSGRFNLDENELCLKPGSERSTAAEPELLDAVARDLADRHGVVEPQRAERRSPDEADTDGGADPHFVGVLKIDGLPQVRGHALITPQ